MNDFEFTYKNLDIVITDIEIEGDRENYYPTFGSASIFTHNPNSKKFQESDLLFIDLDVDNLATDIYEEFDKRYRNEFTTDELFENINEGI